MKIKIINTSSNEVPRHETPNSAGLDLRASIPNGEKIIIKPHNSALIQTGLKVEIPVGYEAQIRPRSGLALKKGVTVLNSPGTIDSDYRGDVGIILINHSNEDFIVENGDKIAQMVVARHERVDFVEAEELSNTDRGEGGFGSTGK